MKKRVFTMMVSVLMLLVATGPATAGSIVGPGTPTLVWPAHGDVVEGALPTFTALTAEGTDVWVFLDGEMVGTTTAVSTAGGVESVKFTATEELSYGAHTLTIGAYNDANGTSSKFTEEITFWYEQELPQPTVLTPVVNEETTWAQPYIVGLAPSDSFVEVWIDGAYDGRAITTYSESGVGDFAYKPSTKLAHGTHSVVTLAGSFRADGSVKASEKTAKKYITVTDPSVEVEESTEEDTTEEVVEEAEATEEVVEETPAEDVVEETAEETPEETVEVESVEASSEAESSEDTPEESSEESEETETETEGEEEADEAEEDDTEDAEEEEVADTETSTTRTVVGWILLIIAAAILVTRFRKRSGGNSGGGSAPSEKKDEVTQPKKDPAKQEQLELHAPKENKNISVMENKKQEGGEKKSDGNNSSGGGN